MKSFVGKKIHFEMHPEAFVRANIAHKVVVLHGHTELHP